MIGRICQCRLILGNIQPSIDERLIDLQMKLQPVGMLAKRKCLHLTALGSCQMPTAVGQLNAVNVPVKHFLLMCEC